MLRRNRKVNDDDDERVLPSVTLLPALQQQYKKPRRRKRRYDNNRIQNLLLDIFLCCLLAVGLYLAPSRIYRNSTIFRSHKRIVSDDSIQKRFNQSTDCPLDPVPGEYPIEFNLVRMLEAWPVDDISNHDGNTFQSLCVFDWNQDREKIDRYRRLELPFIIAGDPQVEEGKKRQILQMPELKMILTLMALPCSDPSMESTWVSCQHVGARYQVFNRLQYHESLYLCQPNSKGSIQR